MIEAFLVCLLIVLWSITIIAIYFVGYEKGKKHKEIKRCEICDAPIRLDLGDSDNRCFVCR